MSRAGPPRGHGVRTPTVLQMEAAECGAAALAMVLAYHGHWIPLEEARQACAVSRDGASALNIVRAARGYGMTAGGRRLTVDQVAAAELPVIAFWGQGHFLVVEAVRRGRFRVNDPASGRRWVPREEFARLYSGITLHFEPGPDFARTPRAERPHPLRGLLGLARRSPAGIALALLAGLLVVVPTTAAALVTSLFVTQVLEDRDDRWATVVLGIAVLVAVTSVALVVLQQRVLLRMQTALAIRTSARFIAHMVRLPTSFFVARAPGALVGRVQLNTNVAQLASGQLATVAISLMTMALYAVVLGWLSLWLLLVALAAAAVNALALAAVARVRIETNKELEQRRLLLDASTFLAADRLDDIRATGADDELFAAWSGRQVPAVVAEQRLGLVTQSLLVVPALLAALDTVAILAVGGWLVIDGRLAIGELIAFQILGVAFLAPVAGVVSASTQFQDARAWLQQIHDVMDQPPDTALVRVMDRDDAPGPADRGVPERLTGALELRDVTFGYTPGAAPLIEGLSMRLEPGQRVALVGRTGSGKSTVANLVAGLYEPWSGEILFDGRPRAAISHAVMTGSLAKVDQSILLFEGTVAENVRLWDDAIPLDDMRRALADAAVEAEILATSGGLSHVLADGGRNLSGGQRQRVEIARALAVDPAILVLDEATSALDTITERRIDEALRRRGCTCLIVAHRLSTVRDCDQILVLEHGAVIERGSHDELMDLAGAYRDLVAHD